MPVLMRGDSEIHYQISGDGPALLLIHGLGSCLLDWEDQIKAFAGTHTVVAADLRGHGESSRPAGAYSIKTFAQDQLALLAALGITRADVVGLSLGGAVAFQVALDAPALVRSLTIVNSFPDFVLKTWPQKLFIWQRKLTIRLMNLEALGKAVAQRMFPDVEHADTRRKFVERYVRNERRPYLASLNALMGWSVADRLDELQCPILVVAADQDYTPVSTKQDYVRKLKNAKLVVIPNSRHATPMERPEAFNRVLKTFLS